MPLIIRIWCGNSGHAFIWRLQRKITKEMFQGRIAGSDVLEVFQILEALGVVIVFIFKDWFIVATGEVDLIGDGESLPR